VPAQVDQVLAIAALDLTQLAFSISRFCIGKPS
jgi:hypothetical protein